MSQTDSPPSSPSDPVGIVQRETILAEPGWPAAFASASSAEVQLGDVPPGAELDVFLGTWCGDSRREVSRFFRALDRVEGELPFSLRLIAVDRSKQTPAGHTDGLDIRFVPTFIVRRDGVEVGRIVESAPHGIETDLLNLLQGTAQGVISGRTDL